MRLIELNSLDSFRLCYCLCNGVGTSGQSLDLFKGADETPRHVDMGVSCYGSLTQIVLIYRTL